MKWGRFVAGFLLILQLIEGSRDALSAETYDFVWEGRLTRADGSPVSGPMALTMSFYNREIGGSPLLTVTDGLDNVLLLEGVYQVRVALSATQYNAAFGNPLQNTYVQVTSRADPTLGANARQLVAMIPYAGRVPVDGNTFNFETLGRLTLSGLGFKAVSGLSSTLGNITSRSDVLEMVAQNLMRGHVHDSSAISDLPFYLYGKAGIDQEVGGDVQGSLSGLAVTGLRGWSLVTPQSSDIGKIIQFTGSEHIFAEGNPGTVTSVSATPPLVVTSQNNSVVVSALQSSRSESGFLSKADFNEFFSKQERITDLSQIRAGSLTTGMQKGITLKSFGGAGGTPGSIRFTALSGQSLGFRAPEISTNELTWLLPSQDGTNLQAITTDGQGRLDWTSPVPSQQTPGEYKKVQTTAQGQVSGGGELQSSDIPELDASKFTSGHITVPGDPVQPLHIAPKRYIDVVKNSVPDETRAVLSASSPLVFDKAIGKLSLKDLDRFGTSNQILGMSGNGENFDYGTLNGTPNQIDITQQAQQVIFSLPQNIAPDTDPSFLGLTLTTLGQGIAHVGSDSKLASSSVDLNSADTDRILPIANGGTGFSGSPGLAENLAGNGAGAYQLTRLGSAAPGKVSLQVSAGSVSIDTSQDIRPFGRPNFAGIVAGESGVDTPDLNTERVHSKSGLNADTIGSDLSISAGQGTGNAASGGLLFFTGSGSSASGSTLSPLTERVILNSEGMVGIGTSVALARVEVMTGLDDVSGLILNRLQGQQSGDFIQWISRNGTTLGKVDALGYLHLPGNPTEGTHASTKSYVDTFVEESSAAIANLTTDDVAEGTNLYFNQDRVKASFGSLSPLTYATDEGNINIKGLASFGSSNQVVGLNSAGSQIEYKSLVETADQISIGHSVGEIVFSLPQDLAQDSIPTFTNVKITAAGSGPAKIGLEGHVAASKIDLSLEGILEETTGLLPIGKGGTGITDAPISGQTLVGTTLGSFRLGQLNEGPTHGIDITTSSGQITLDTPQSISVAASPIFTGITTAAGGVTSPFVTTGRIQPEEQSSSDANGENLKLDAGRGSGTEGSGRIEIWTGGAGTTSGSASNALALRASITPEGNVGIGVNAPDARFEIGTGGVNTVGMIVKATSGTQVSDLAQWQDDQGMPRLSVNKAGHLKLPGAPVEELHAVSKKYFDDALDGTQSAIRNLTTSVVPEGTNHYFTTTRSRNVYSAQPPLVYSSASGAAIVKGLSSFGENNHVWSVANSDGDLTHKALVGTPDQLTLNHDAGRIILGAPQNISVTSNPIFSGLVLSGPSRGPLKLGLNGTIATSHIDLAGGGIQEEVSGTLPITKGGTGNANTPLIGQFLIGNNSAGYTLGYLGVGPGLTVTNSSGEISISASQNLSATMDPTFYGLHVGESGIDSSTLTSTPLVNLGAEGGTSAPENGLLRGAAATGADKPGVSVTIKAGNGTGSGGSGDIQLATASPSLSSESDANSSVNRMTILSNGRVGVGTSTPSGTLAIKATSNSTPGMRLSNASSNQNSDLAQWLGADGSVVMGVDKNGFLFQTNFPTLDPQSASKEYVDSSVASSNASLIEFQGSALGNGGSDTQFWRGDKTWGTLTSDIVQEGAENLFFTVERARESLSGVALVSYNSATGLVGLLGLNALGTPKKIMGMNENGSGLTFHGFAGVTAQQIGVDDTTQPGTIKFSIPQDIAASNSPTLSGLTLGSMAGSAGILHSDVTGALSSSLLNLNADTTAAALSPMRGGTGQTAEPTQGQTLIGTNAGLFASANFTEGTHHGLVVTNGSGQVTFDTTQDIRSTASPTFSGVTAKSGGVASPWVVASSLQGEVAPGADLSGGTTQLEAGAGTGTADSGNIEFSTSVGGASGSSPNTLVNRLTIKESGLVGIGTSTPSGRLHIATEATNNPGLVVSRGGASQTSDLMQWRDPGDAILSRIDKWGFPIVVGNPKINLHAVSKGFVDLAFSESYGFLSNLTTTDLPEGSNLYYTPNRFRTLLSATTPLEYDSSSMRFSLKGIDTLGSENQIIGMNGAGNGFEFKTFSAVQSISITQIPGEIKLNTAQGITSTSSPVFSGLRITSLGAGSVRSNSTGVLSSSPVALTSADVTGVLGVGNGGTNSATSPTNGQLLVGNGTHGRFSPANLITGAGLSVTNAAGALTIQTVQDLQTTSTPTFDGIRASTDGVTSQFFATRSLQGKAATGTNVNGTNFAIAGGNGTGTGSSGAIEFRTGTGGASGSTVTGVTTRMTVVGSGNVGIGTLDPKSRLEVVTGGDNVPGMIIRAQNSTQTADLTRWLSASDTVSSRVDKSGYVFLPDVMPTGNNQAISKSYVDANLALISSGISNLTTTRVAEGSRQYYTPGRMTSALTAVAPLEYSSSTGVVRLAGVSALGTANQIIGLNAAGGGFEFKSLTTSSNITSSPSTGSMALDAAQNIKTSATPIFAGLNLTGLSTGILKTNSSGVVSSSAIALASGDVTGLLPPLKGGTGTSTTPLNGQVLIGKTSTGVYSPATLTAGSSLSISNGAGAITIDTVQDLRPSAKPTFLGLSAGTSVDSQVLIAGSGDGMTTAVGGTMRAANITGNNLAGADTAIDAGMGTGSESSGSIVMRTAANGGPSGTTPNTPAARVVIDPAGNVGIGSLLPGATLDLYGSGAVESRITSTTGLAKASFAGASSGTVLNTLGDFTVANTSVTGAVTLGTNNSEVMRVTSAGDVGVGSTAPTAKVQVLTGSATNPGVIVQGSGPSQTGNLTEWLGASSSTPLSYIDKNGFYFPPATAPSNSRHSITKGYVDNITSSANVAIATKEPSIGLGTVSQYWRGDKTWQDLTTDVSPEGTTNKYYKDVLSKAGYSATSPVSYSFTDGRFSMVNSGVIPRQYTRSSLTVDQFGRVTAASSGLTLNSSDLTDATILNADISETASIADTKLANIVSAGKVGNTATSAQSSSGSNTIVVRDALGNFEAGTITATLSGSATSITGILGMPQGGTGLNLSTTGGSGNLLKKSTAGSPISVEPIATSDIAWQTPGAIGQSIPKAATFTSLKTTTGNIGIGTAPSTDKLKISAGYSVFNDILSQTNQNYGVMLSVDRNYGLDLGYSNANTWATRLYTKNGTGTGAGDIVFAKTKTTPPTLQEHFTDLVTIKQNGNVGVGSTAPTEILDVKNKLKVRGDGVIISAGTANTFTGMIETNAGLGDRFGLGQFAGGQLALYMSDTQASSAISFGRLTDTPEFINQMHITKVGNVGIANQTPTEKLEVGGNIAIPYGSSISVAPSSSWPSGTNFLLGTGTNGTNDTLSIYTPGSKRSSAVMTMLATGSVGIGTNNPGYRLTLSSTHTNALGLANGAGLSGRNTQGDYEVFMVPRGADDMMTMKYGSNGFTIRNNSSNPSVTMLDSGNIGIGSSLPDAKLKLGNGQIVGSYFANSVATIDWHKGNVQSLNTAAGAISIASSSMIDGSVYNLLLNNATGGDYSFSSTDITFKCSPRCPVTVYPGRETLVSIVKVGPIAYVSWQWDFM